MQRGTRIPERFIAAVPRDTEPGPKDAGKVVGMKIEGENSPPAGIDAGCHELGADSRWN